MGPSPKDQRVTGDQQGLDDYLGEKLDSFKQWRNEATGLTPKIPVQDRPAAYPVGGALADGMTKTAAAAPVAPVVATPAATPPATSPVTPVVTPPAAPAKTKPVIQAANYPTVDTISNLGNKTSAQDLDARTGKAVGIGTASDYAGADPGRVRLTNAAQGQESNQSVVASESVQTGFMPPPSTAGQPMPAVTGSAVNPKTGKTEPVFGNTLLSAPVQASGGSSGVPQYQTNYTIFGKDGQQGTASIVGPDKRAGGGTLSVVNTSRTPEEQKAIDETVAGIDKQTAAMTSLREAMNPGITTGTGRFAPRQEAPNTDPFGGDSERRAKYDSLINEAANQKGMGASKRSARMLAAAQAILNPGLESAKLNQEGQRSKDSLAAQLAQNQAASQDRRFAAETNSQDRRYAADASLAGNRLTAEQQRAKNEIDAYAAANPRQSGQDNLTNRYLALFEKSTDPNVPQEQRANYKTLADQLAPLVRAQPQPSLVEQVDQMAKKAPQ